MARNLWFKILRKTMDIKNLSIVRQSFANTVFTHKVQEVAAENQERNLFKVKVANIVLVGAVLVLLVLQASNPGNLLFSYLAAGITIAEIIFLIIQLSFSFEQRVVMHKNSALKYMGLRDSYRSLIVDIMNASMTTDILIAKRELLQREYQIISDLAPQTGDKEYDEAQIRLNKRGVIEGEEFTWSDEEIDRFLPENLRLNKNN
ncbi:SLATT domain-containing protein [Candidatus Peregrinibacteria bacterium]|nr:SLATT domain-containing protein [Candidatus Peregrinibacteria bacterium]